jgi:hypothetical protein
MYVVSSIDLVNYTRNAQAVTAGTDLWDVLGFNLTNLQFKGSAAGTGGKKYGLLAVRPLPECFQKACTRVATPLP